MNTILKRARRRRVDPNLNRFQRGIASLEMALVAGPMFLSLMAVIEIGYTQLLSTMLDIGVDEAARQIRTGQVQQSGNPMGTFNSILCGRVSRVMNCSDLVVDARNYSQFSGLPDSSIPEQGSTSFQTGNAGDIIVVRVAYPWSFKTPMLASAMSGWASNIVSSFVFRNEPYER